MSKDIINFDEAYPKRGERGIIITSENGNVIFNRLVKQFNAAKKTSVSVKAFMQNEINGLELMRDKKNPVYSYNTPDGIDLYPLFLQGWNDAILGKDFTLPDCYKRSPEIKEQIKAGYSEKGTPPGYFEYFAPLACNEVATGWACAKIYYWLKEGQQQPTQTPEPETQQQQQQQPTPADKIAEILEPLRGAFGNPEHIDTIIEGFVSFKVDSKLPSVNKAKVSIEPREFIKPFRKLFDLNILKREQMSMLLLYFIKKNSMNETGFSQGYINKLLSESKPD